MNKLSTQQKAVIEAAQRDGKSIAESAAELLTYDLVETVLSVLRKQNEPFKKLTEQQQDHAISNITDEIREAVALCAEVIASGGHEAVSVKLGTVALGKTIKLQASISTDEPNLHSLFDRTSEQANALLILYPQDYYAGLGSIKGEPDQKGLPLEQEAKAATAPKATTKQAPKPKAGAKPVEVTPAQLEAAREFVTKQQNGTVAGLQNQLKCNNERALAIHAALAAEGLLTDPVNDRQDRELVRSKPDAKQEAKQEQASEEEKPAANFLNVRRFVVETGQYTKTLIAKYFGISQDDALTYLDQLESSGIISAEDEMGKRKVLVKE